MMNFVVGKRHLTEQCPKHFEDFIVRIRAKNSHVLHLGILLVHIENIPVSWVLTLLNRSKISGMRWAIKRSHFVNDSQGNYHQNYLGGVPFDQLVTPFGSSQGFEGCIGSFQVGYQTSTIPVSFTSATSGIDIRQC